MYLESDDHEDLQNDMAEGLVPPELHHRLSDAPVNAFNLAEFLQSSPDDPALQVRFTLVEFGKLAHVIVGDSRTSFPNSRVIFYHD